MRETHQTASGIKEKLLSTGYEHGSEAYRRAYFREYRQQNLEMMREISRKCYAANPRSSYAALKEKYLQAQQTIAELETMLEKHCVGYIRKEKI